MPNAVDVHRATLSAAAEMNAKLADVSATLQRIRSEVDALTQNSELRRILRQEQTWVEQAERTVHEVQRWRNLEAYRFWPGVVYRWALALAFALAGAWAVGAGYAWVTNAYPIHLADPRPGLELLDFIEQRAATLTPSERRQVDEIMRWPIRMSLAGSKAPKSAR
jgi:hypothetical protein